LKLARSFLAGLSWLERSLCIGAFALMALALIADVLAREFRGAGLLGAPQVGLIGLTVVAMFGFGLAAQTGGQLRVRFLDGVFPRRWDRVVFRVADLVSAAMLGLMATLCAAMAWEAVTLKDVSSVLRWPIWPVQSAIALAFALNAARYLLFAAFPDLRPAEDPVPETAELETVPGKA
jgi:TRAP-type C4-dicarboxylate transport system permease small subunit